MPARHAGEGAGVNGAGVGTGTLSRGRASRGTRGTGGDEGCRGTLLCIRPCPPTPWVLSVPDGPSDTIAVGIKRLIPSRAGSSSVEKHSPRHGHELWVQGRMSWPPAPVGAGQGCERGEAGVSHGLPPRSQLAADPRGAAAGSTQRVSPAAPRCCRRLGVHGCPGLRSRPTNTQTQLQDQSEPHFSWFGGGGGADPARSAGLWGQVPGCSQRWRVRGCCGARDGGGRRLPAPCAPRHPWAPDPSPPQAPVGRGGSGATPCPAPPPPPIRDARAAPALSELVARPLRSQSEAEVGGEGGAAARPPANRQPAPPAGEGGAGFGGGRGLAAQDGGAAGG